MCIFQSSEQPSKILITARNHFTATTDYRYETLTCTVVVTYTIVNMHVKKVVIRNVLYVANFA